VLASEGDGLNRAYLKHVWNGNLIFFFKLV